MIQKLQSLLKIKAVLSSRLFNVGRLHTYVYDMEKAYVKCLTGAETFQFSFQFSHPVLKEERKFNFERKLNETVGEFLYRIRVNVEKVLNKKKRKTKQDASAEEIHLETIQLLQNNTPVEGALLIQELFKVENALQLSLDNKQYKILINAPWINTISLPKALLSGFPAYPTKFASVFTDLQMSTFEWFTSNNKKHWTKVGDGYKYIPSNEDVGLYLKLRCTPTNEFTTGPAVEVESTVTVQAGPLDCPFERRQLFTKEQLKGREFRIVTYNILADLYCDSEFSRKELYPYCPESALHIDYRKQLILKELTGYNADIICLQEVDVGIYENHLKSLHHLGYDSHFAKKAGPVNEGLACFYNKARFSFLKATQITLGEEITTNPVFREIWDKVSQNEKLVERIANRQTVVQTVALISKETEEILLIANTHLYFHPDADHIRLLQGGMAIKYIQDVSGKLSLENENKRNSLIFCGDFNSVPQCGIYQLYTTGTVPHDLVDWSSNAEEAVKNLSLQNTKLLTSACGTPKYTNYTIGFADCLDYIFYERDNFEVVQSVPLPTEEELKKNIALPSIKFPSDHIALVADLKLL